MRQMRPVPIVSKEGEENYGLYKHKRKDGKVN